jgi:hypothetical protein
MLKSKLEKGKENCKKKTKKLGRTKCNFVALKFQTQNAIL